MGMMKVRSTVLLVCLVTAATRIGAQTIEVALIQSPGQIGTRATRSSEFVIEGALSALFDAGLIATNSRPQDGGIASFREFSSGLVAKDDFIDYVIVIFAEYPAMESVTPGQTLPVPACQYRLLRVRDGFEVGSGAIPVVLPVSRLEKELDNACRAMGVSIGLVCDVAVRRVSASWRNHEYCQA
jgi:hypothetical protein